MARSDIYEPKQKRSIEKKNHIIIETGIYIIIPLTFPILQAFPPVH